MIKRTLYFTNPAKLSTINDQLLVETGNPQEGRKEVRQIPIEDIGIVILEHPQIVLTHVLMDKLLSNNVVLITCNDKKMPSGIMLPFEGNTLLQVRYQDQIEASEPLKKNLWQQTIQAKIRNQAAILEKNNIDATKMKVWANDVLSGDSNNYEGVAAAYYFDKIFIHFITKFKRSREGDAPNNLLNYGYAIIRAVVARSLVASGLLPALGIHHRNKYNAYCLADDIMEPYRPFVDDLVIELIKQEVDISTLTKEIKQKLLVLPTIDVIINNERSPLLIATQTTTSGLVKCYSGEVRKMVYPQFQQ